MKMKTTRYTWQQDSIDGLAYALTPDGVLHEIWWNDDEYNRGYTYRTAGEHVNGVGPLETDLDKETILDAILEYEALIAQYLY